MRWGLLALLVSLTVGQAIGSTVVNFDDLPYGSVPASYGGIDWSASTWWMEYDSPPYFPAHSQPYSVFSHDSSPTWVFETPSRFEGVWFNGNNDSETSDQTINVKLFDTDDNLVWEATTPSLNPPGLPVWFGCDYTGWVERVTLTPVYFNRWTMDDVTYTAAPGLPAVSLVVFAPLAGAIVRRLRKS